MRKGIFFLLAFLLCSAYILAGKNSVTPPSASASLEKLAAGQVVDDRDQARDIVREFGQRIKYVYLNYPQDTVVEYMRRYYGDLLAPDLLMRWQLCQDIAPGRTVDYRRPDRIEVTSVKKLSDTQYEVQGKLIEVSEDQAGGGGIAARRPITLYVSLYGENWLISDGAQGNYEDLSVKTLAASGKDNTTE